MTQQRNRGTRRGARGPTAVLAAAGLILALTVGACGDDDDDCGYQFADVPDLASCEGLADEFDCNSFSFNSTAFTCQVGGCLICGDIDTDFDGDFDTDGDIDADA